MATDVRNFLIREIEDFWRVDLTGLCLTMGLGIFLRTQLFNSLLGGLVVTLLLEPFTLVVVLAVRPLFLRLNPALKFAALPIVLTALLFAVAALVTTLWAKYIWITTGWKVPTWNTTQSWLVPWAYYYFVLVSWNTARLWVAAERAARAEKERAIMATAEAMKAELQHLRHQLDPHFLFNSLGGIATEITHRPKAAVRMVRGISDYLRYSLDHRDVGISRLDTEIDAVRSYLDLQKARHGRNLKFKLTMDKAALRQRTPAFLLQPLVENAVKHGLKSGVTPVDIIVKATCDGPELRIVVANSGTLRPNWADGNDPGVGLSVLRRRLALHYPERHAFDMSQTGDTVTAQLVLQGEPCSA